MTLAEKHVRHYNRLNGGKHSRKALETFHEQLRKDIQSKKIDAHVQYGVECIEIEKRIARALPKAASTVTVICDKPVKIRKPKVVIKQTDRGPEIVKKRSVKAMQKRKTAKKKRTVKAERPEDLAMFYGLPCNPPEAEGTGLGFTRDGQQKIYDMVNTMILETMKTDGLFWRLPWKESKGLLTPGVFAQNFSTKKKYRGINYVVLNYYAHKKRGHNSPYYLTLKQADELGGKIRKGAKSLPVFFYNVSYFITKPEKKRISEEQAKAMSQDQQAEKGLITMPIIQYYNVFNSEDIEGINFPELPKGTPREGIETAEKIVEAMPKRPRIEHSDKTEAYYSPGEDYIHMPKLDWFEKEQEYYSTIFHEMVHSTGHKSRLDRKFGVDKQTYAYEELIAEIGASYLCAEAGVLYFTLKNSAAYIQGWKEKVNAAVKADPKFFLKVSAKAQKASDFILNFEEDQVAKAPKSKRESKRPRLPVERETRRKAPKEHSRSLNGVVDASTIGALTFTRIELDGQYQHDFLKIYSDTALMIWGAPGQGKTVYLLNFAQYLADKKGLKVLYVAHEELGRSTFTEKINEFKIGHPNLKFVKSLEKLKAEGMNVDDFDVVFFDSINSMGMSLDQYRKFAEEHSGIIKILIVQSTKDGDFRGGKEWEHEVDIAGEIKSRKLILRKNRLDQSFAEKSESLEIDEMVKERKRKEIIKRKVEQSNHEENNSVQ